jgi:hypothetical protein
MAYSLYDATIVMAQGALTSLDRMLAEAEKHPNSASFFNARLIEDMEPLTFQVHYAAFQGQSLAAVLSGQDCAEPNRDLDSWEKMHVLIDQTLQMLVKLDKDEINRRGETKTSYTVGSNGPSNVPVKALAGQLHMPNIYFHVSMAYAILRMEGVPLKKRDWSRAFVSEYV